MTPNTNMAELDAVIKGLNLAFSWQMRRIRLMTDSATVHRWVTDGLSGKARLKTKASVRIREGSRPCEIRVQQGKRINPRAAAVAEATRSWTGARLCGDRGSGRGANDRRCPSCHGPPGNKTNVVLCKANQDLDALRRHLAARCCLRQGHATLTCHYLRPA
ncbi:hypothetical protein T06_13251 [Trichinella sp. T6]|nr:hypothetical protein T06_13251 [Trichinella sp. T6]